MQRTGKVALMNNTLQGYVFQTYTLLSTLFGFPTSCSHNMVIARLSQHLVLAYN